MSDLVTRVQQLLQDNQYLTLATSDASGRPWSSTVWYCRWPHATSEEQLAVEVIWLSRPDAQHSRNLRQRPEVGISIFDSTQHAGAGEGLQLAAHAHLLPREQLDEAVAAFSTASLAAGGEAWTRTRVEEPALLRMYVARADSVYLLGNCTRVAVPLA